MPLLPGAGGGTGAGEPPATGWLDGYEWPPSEVPMGAGVFIGAPVGVIAGVDAIIDGDMVGIGVMNRM